MGEMPSGLSNPYRNGRTDTSHPILCEEPIPGHGVPEYLHQVSGNPITVSCFFSINTVTEGKFMNIKRALLLLGVLLATSAVAADSENMRLSELLSSKKAKKVLGMGVTLYWAGSQAPVFKEYSLPTRYTGKADGLLSISRHHCVEAFEDALEGMVEDAENKGYDAIVDLALVIDGQSAPGAQNYTCKLGSRATSVTLSGSFALSDGAIQRVAEEEKESLKVGPRQPAKGAVFLPLEPVLTSPEAKAILGEGLSVDWHFPAQHYAIHKGPMEYEGKAEITAAGNEAACKNALLNALGSAATEARAEKYDRIIKVRSYLKDEYAPDLSQFECAISPRGAQVTMHATLAATRN